MKKTHHPTSTNSRLTIGLAIIGGFLILIFAAHFIDAFSLPDSLEKMVQLIGCAFFLILLLGGFIAGIIGVIRGRRAGLRGAKAARLTNPHQYFRELPNSYGIGIATLLVDSTIEQEKDIIAAILDLCAQGYLKLKYQADGGYRIKVLTRDTSHLLENERYLINQISAGHIAEIDFDQWYKLCVTDGVNLGLFTERSAAPKLAETDVAKPTRTERKARQKAADEALALSLAGKAKKLLYIGITLTPVITIILTTLVVVHTAPRPITAEVIISTFLSNLIFTIFVLIFTLAPIYAIYYVWGTFTSNTSIIKSTYHTAYQQKLAEYLELTPKGAAELQKLYAFEKFLTSFGSFRSVDEEQIILWDHYLSYATVFGLADQVLSSGYEKLVKNSSFELDNISALNLRKIRLDS